MERLTKEEYKNMINQAGLVARFIVKQIEELRYNPDFCDALGMINQNKSIKINDTSYLCTIPFRMIDRNNETLCIRKITNKEIGKYEDEIIYYLNIDFNKKIRLGINYNDLVINENHNKTIHFEILEDYIHRECGDIYSNNGKIVEDIEFGYKGKMYTQKDICILEYRKYGYDNTTILFPDEKYEYNNTIPELNNIETEIITYKLTQGINNPVFLVLNKTQEEKLNPRQRVR